MSENSDNNITKTKPEHKIDKANKVVLSVFTSQFITDSYYSLDKHKGGCQRLAHRDMVWVNSFKLDVEITASKYV